MRFKKIDPEQVIEFLSREYGVPEKELANLSFWSSGKRVWASSDVILPKGVNIQGIGIVIGKMKEGRIIPSNALFKNFTITKKKIELRSEKEVRTFMSGGTIKIDNGPRGIVCASYNGENIGKGLSNGKEVLSQVPKEFRAKGIHIP